MGRRIHTMLGGRYLIRSAKQHYSSQIETYSSFPDSWFTAKWKGSALLALGLNHVCFRKRRAAHPGRHPPQRILAIFDESPWASRSRLA